MATNQFDKDFGYLMPFLDKVAGAASALSDPDARTELTRLIAEEKQRWARIRDLLSGGTYATRGSAASSSVAAPVPASVGAKVVAAAEKQAASFTVGSLRSVKS
ncbi:MAG: hypothetical protein WAV47_11700 [Blastocatellia bacterium]